MVEQSLIRDGIRFVLDCKIQGVQKQDGDRMLQIEWRGQKSELRADAINVLNKPQWGLPNTNINSAMFGRITTATGSRMILLNGRVDF